MQRGFVTSNVRIYTSESAAL